MIWEGPGSVPRFAQGGRNKGGLARRASQWRTCTDGQVMFSQRKPECGFTVERFFTIVGKG
jgi:hypothetical protein